jgi:hypothetical protein
MISPIGVHVNGPITDPASIRYRQRSVFTTGCPKPEAAPQNETSFGGIVLILNYSTLNGGQ